MKKFIFCLASLLLASSTFALDMNLQTTKVSCVFAETGAKTEIVTLNNKPAVKWTWDSTKKSWSEMYWSGPGVIYWQKGKELTIDLGFQAGKAIRPSGVTLRFLDSTGETLATGASITYDADGKGTASFTIKADEKFNGSWGGNKNGKLDFPVRLLGMATILPPDKKGPGEVNITKVAVTSTNGELKVEQPKRRSIEFDLVTDHPMRVVEYGKETLCFASIIADPKPDTLVNISLTVKDVDDKVISQTEPKTWHLLYGGHRVMEPVTVPKKFGYYTVEATLTFPKDPASNCTLSRSFVYMNPTGHKVPYKEGQFMFSMMARCGNKDWEPEARGMETIGVRFTREGCGMVNIIPSQDVEQPQYFQCYLKFFRSHGIQPLILMGGPHRWAIPETIDGKPNTNKMPDLDQWRRYCRLHFQSYGDLCPAFEMLNEPDLEHFSKLNVEQYTILAKIAREEINKYAPHSKLMSSGFCNFDGKNHFQENALTLCKDLFDIHCYHGHGSFPFYKRLIDEKLLTMRSRLGILKSMPWFAHETAISSTGYGLKFQGTTLYKKIIFSFARGAIGYTWYDFRNDGYDPRNSEHNYGIVTADHYPKPAYISYNTVAGLYNGNTSFEKDMCIDGIEIYRFKRDANQLVALWAMKEGFTTELSFETNAKQAVLVDWFGNETKLDIVNGIVAVPCSDVPATLKLIHSSTCELTKGYTTPIKQEFTIRNGETVKMTFNVTNPLPKQENVQLTFTFPQGMTGEKIVSIDIPAKKTVEVSVPVTASDTVHFDQIIRTTYAYANGLKGYFDVRAILVTRLPRDFASEPNLVMNEKTQIFEYFDANPATEKRLWRGPADLSAKVYLAATRQELKIKTVVADDVHIQKQTAGAIWKNDSVQFYLSTPNLKNVFQFGCALGENKKPILAIWRTDTDPAHLQKVIKTQVIRDEKAKTTTYFLTIPWTAIKVNPLALPAGFKFNVLVNDSDFDDQRDCDMHFAEGVGGYVSDLEYPSFEVAP